MSKANNIVIANCIPFICKQFGSSLLLWLRALILIKLEKRRSCDRSSPQHKSFEDAHQLTGHPARLAPNSRALTADIANRIPFLSTSFFDYLNCGHVHCSWSGEKKEKSITVLLLCTSRPKMPIKGMHPARLAPSSMAIAEVGTGQTSYNSAIRNALKQTADSGIRVLDYESGYSRRLDSAMRQNVLDGVKDIAHEVATRTGEQFGADGVEIDAHNYCAPDHLPFQGKQFKKSEFEDIQNSLPRQFGMWSCRHTFYAILLGVSPPLYTEDERQEMIAQSTEKIEFEGKQYTRYEATQLQRRIETSVRKSKDRALIFKASGDDLGRRIEQLRINQLKQKYGEITNTFKTPPALDRMSVSGFRPVKATLPRVAPIEDDILPKPVLGQHFIPGTGQIELIVPSGTDLINVRIIAGKGTSTPFRAASSWVESYGGKPDEWQKIVGTVDGKHYSYEIHWVHHNGVKYELKIKRTERR